MSPSEFTVARILGTVVRETRRAAQESETGSSVQADLIQGQIQVSRNQGSVRIYSFCHQRLKHVTNCWNTNELRRGEEVCAAEKTGDTGCEQDVTAAAGPRCGAWAVGPEGRVTLQQRHVQSRLAELCRAKQNACQLFS